MAKGRLVPSRIAALRSRCNRLSCPGPALGGYSTSIGPDETLLPARSIGLCLTALPLVMTIPAAASAAQEPAPASESQPVAEPVIEFSADEVAYENQADVVTAQGQVRMSRDGNYLAADKVSWDRRSGRVLAEGNVVVMTPQGDKLVSDKVDLTDTLRDGAVENLLIVLEGGGRIAAVRGSRAGDVTQLENAVYTACPVVTAAGCPKNPSWKITATRVTHDRTSGRIRFSGGRLTVLGVPLPLLPIFSIGDGSGEGGFSGALVPGVRIDSNNGLEVDFPYYWRID